MFVTCICVCPQVQALISQEVHRALRNSETKLQGLIEAVEQLDREVDFKSSIQKLEVCESSDTCRAHGLKVCCSPARTEPQWPPHQYGVKELFFSCLTTFCT